MKEPDPPVRPAASPGDRSARSADELAAEALGRDEPTAWFEVLYSAAADGRAVIPWDRGQANPLLVDWLERASFAGKGRRALVVGAGLGHDAEFVAGRGFETTAFDVSPTAVQAARERHPGSPVDYRSADLLALPEEWAGAFDLAVEIHTVQALPRDLRQKAIEGVVRTVAPGGTLMVIARILEEGEDPEAGPPWPLTRVEMEAFGGPGTTVVGIEKVPHPAEPGSLRWLGVFRRA
jgi:hypothetical protein